MYLDEVQYEQLFLYLRFLIAVFCGSRKINTKDLESHLAPWVHFRIRTDRCLKRIVLWPLSLSNLAAKTGRIIQSQCVTATQTKSTGAVELGFRLSKSAMDETGITIIVDILYDKEENQWMIKKISEGGFGVSGQKTSTAVTHRVLLD